jgi:hypothetical protein
LSQALPREGEPAGQHDHRHDQEFVASADGLVHGGNLVKRLGPGLCEYCIIPCFGQFYKREGRRTNISFRIA